MGYNMEIYVDGGCRRNGSSNAIGAAAAVRKERSGRYWHRQERLTGFTTATNQRAEITAIIIGLEMVLEKFAELDSNPHLNITVHSDSRYAVGCMTEWIYKWTRNGWTNSRGEPVANQDLIERASALDDEVAELGNINYVWIPRSENTHADKHCNEELDAMEREEGIQYHSYYSDSD
jgi:ribonuclease HI